MFETNLNNLPSIRNLLNFIRVGFVKLLLLEIIISQPPAPSPFAFSSCSSFFKHFVTIAHPSVLWPPLLCFAISDLFTGFDNCAWIIHLIALAEHCDSLTVACFLIEQTVFWVQQIQLRPPMSNFDAIYLFYYNRDAL